MNERDPSSDPEGQEAYEGDRLLIRTWSDGEALMLRELLGSYGIPSQVVSDVPHSVLPLTVDGLGEIRILVPASRVDEARSVLAEHLRQGLEIVKGGRSEAGGGDEEDEGAA